MKTISILFLLLVSYSSFGQSAKKLNKQLHAELLVHQQKQDSSEKVFLEEREILEQVRNDIRNKTKTVLYPEDQKLRKTVSSITGLINTLRYLEVDIQDQFPAGSVFDSYPNYKTFIKPLSEARDKFVKFDHFYSDEFNLDNYKRKEQNELLGTWIKKYETYADRNQANFQTQRNYIEQLTSFYPRIDSLLQVYQAFNRELEAKNDWLLKKLEVARENYRVKGPKGFSKAYQDQFPDIHPVIAEKITSTDFGFVTSENAEADNVGSMESEMVVAPKIAEAVQEPKIFDVTDEPASFPGGVEAMKMFIAKNLKYPESMKEANIQGRVYLKFTVSESGELSDIKIARSIPDCPECDIEAKRVVQAMPKWIPAKNGGKVVKSYYSLPVNFKLE